MTQHPSPPSNCETGGFALLDREVQRWVWEQRWDALRPVQEQAIAPVLGADTDVVITAATAGGKTEAAFLPVCSALVEQKRVGKDTGVQAVYVSPLKALINDQHRRISGLCSRLGVPVTPWHGDVAAARKTRFRESPSGILLITPESLEAMLVLNGSTAPELFAELSYIVVDELHAFLGTNRGAQLRSLMHRLEHAAGHRAARIGLSATLADLAHAAEYLRPGGGDRVVVIQDTGAGKQVELQVRGYVDDLAGNAGRAAACTDVADHLYRYSRNGHNMVFANSRAEVEAYSGLLSKRAERDRLPDPFLPHHGSLSAELRKHAEERLRQRSSPATVVCTSTLELGIDVGWVDTVVQIGIPASVAGLRQRLGRSGRGDARARLLVYVTEQSSPEALVETLRLGLVQAAATVDLLLERWYEPPGIDTPNHSTLVQQVLALLAQFSGATADRLYSLLCASGVFPRVSPQAFADLLRSMGEHELLTQERSSGLLLPGKLGERLMNHYTFYAAFDTTEEFQVVASGNRIGTMPVGPSVTAGTLLAFGGRTWRVVEVHHDEARLLVKPAPGTGVPPGFSGSAAPVSDGVRRRMLRIYTGDDSPAYLDEAASILLEEARGAFRTSGLNGSSVLPVGEDLLLFPWRSDAVVATLCHLLGRYGLRAETANGVVLVHGTSPEHLAETARRLVAQEPPEPLELAAEATGKYVDKYDRYLPRALLDQAHADRSVDVPGAMEVLHHLAQE
ncbi:ATP-dependent Lhr-like helicase [Nocardiopsis arvandica]|uniref:ATP-dependent Lhr-like helicase n=1 Tax=Nocardiopsis sinuspersici TaxID=501010 RepID=A0A7Y9X750_9ACTN|nr:DEAD/DEAH box helicase [Nocardiopsis sinuspersici]NYH50452.1 ATP-dependent Lhr-like helicase [Nocardiopsis sinuspersici]